jgi:hypothetical protein
MDDRHPKTTPDPLRHDRLCTTSLRGPQAGSLCYGVAKVAGASVYGKKIGTAHLPMGIVSPASQSFWYGVP